MFYLKLHIFNIFDIEFIQVVILKRMNLMSVHGIRFLLLKFQRNKISTFFSFKKRN